MTKRVSPRGRGTGQDSKHGYLLQDEDVRRWYLNVARGSQITADVYLRRLGNFREDTKLLPKDLVRMNQKALGNRLLDYIGEKEGTVSPGYLNSVLKAVRSWLNFYGKPLKTKLTVRLSNSRPTVDGERVPTQDELRRILLSATKRDRVSVALMAHSGLRPGVLGSYLGDNGLRVRDLPELKIEGKTVSFEKIPAIIVIPMELSKTRNRYTTFLSEEGCGYLKEYLEERIRGGEKLTADSSVISPKWLEGKQFITTIKVSDGVRNAIRKAGFEHRPYVLRSFFDTQLLLAESKIGLPHDYRVHWMGHSGSMEARYTVNKSMPDSLVEDMRASYLKCQQFLQTIPQKEEHAIEKRLIHALLKMAHYDDREIEAVDISKLSDEQLEEMLRKGFGATNGGGQGNGSGHNGGFRQKLVGALELERYVEEGWEIVHELLDGRIAVKHNG
ncbi:MAG: site-specific integrase [Thermoplasmata archaeon]|nr:site-specific integrase [Candidatus Sysuiplasma jiujiangense]